MENQKFILNEENDIYFHINGKTFSLLKYYKTAVELNRFIKSDGVYTNIADEMAVYYEDAAVIKERAAESLKPYRKVMDYVINYLCAKNTTPLALLKFDDITYRDKTGKREYLKLKPCYIIYLSRESEEFVLCDTDTIVDMMKQSSELNEVLVAGYINLSDSKRFSLEYKLGQEYYAHSIYKVTVVHPTGISKIELIFDQPIHLECQFLYPKRVVLSKDLVVEYIPGSSDDVAKVIFYHMVANHRINPIGIMNYASVKAYLPPEAFGVWDKSESD